MSRKHHKYVQPQANAVIEKPQERRASPIQYILDQQKLRTRQDLLRLRVAVDGAENIYNYNRYMLHLIYRDIIKDLDLTSNWESRKMKVKQRPFKVVKIGNEDVEDDEKTDILENSLWFWKWVDACLESIMWGFTLIEFGPLDIATGAFMPYRVGKKMYEPINILDRDNVKPELGIITKIPGDAYGLDMADPKYADNLMFIGSFTEHGMLNKLAKYILFKDNAFGNWSEWAEVFGMDKRIGKTEAEGDDRKRFMTALRDLGANAYGVFNKTDEVEYVGTQRVDAFKVYHEMIKEINSSVAKIIFGQDVVANNTGKVVGAVGENVSNMYGDSDARFIKSLINEKLFPLMSNLGCKIFDGYKFKWDTTEKLSLKDRAEVDYKISQMGKEHSDEYINNTYGTDVTQKEMPEPVGNPIKNFYGDSR